VSYIRSTSNPESLYVTTSTDGMGTDMVSISHGVQAPLSDGADFAATMESFRRVCQKWADGNEDASSGGFSAKEVHVEVSTGKRARTRDSLAEFLKRPASEMLVRISSGPHYLHLWRVTWDYVVRRVLADAEEEKAERRAKLAAKTRKKRARKS
jgi:hypothetical protein